ncbi:PilC/PilY family type IV pilus protein [Paucibacter sp. R3-3]|uniref:PilC/PilY family type IV pilus protein n=1 Tax=Roseateles agri TaxID=3098619 RepID=A0ABU5DEZ1_9BURK|nr:PilC/PilY family type IV pilus protein [Paucibacter sp. R3-3]MDY0744333.1 PilC/PilY family type IV pilus protein [Paucibacter sp. R3-3]
MGWLGLTAALAGGSPLALADTDIATAPLFTTSTSQVKPNVMFVLDDSGSMSWDYLPDDADFAVPASGSNGNVQYGRRTAQCNGVAYNPTITYTTPKNADGTSQADNATTFLNGANPVANTYNRRLTTQSNLSIVSSGTLSLTVNVSNMRTAWYPVGSVVTVFNGLSTSQNYMMGTVKTWDASSGAITITVLASVGSGKLDNVTVGDGTPVLQYYYKYATPTDGTAMSYRYPGNVLTTNSTFYTQCASTIGSSPGADVFTLVIVTPSSSEAKNYANWYKFYRTRMLMMQTAASQAFSPMNSDYRIGFTTINDSTVTSSGFLNVSDFDSTQKTSFYSKLMSASPTGSTPLRGALSKVGRYYAMKADSQTYDPVQYSCQKNFTILSTDGYWNTPVEVTGKGAALNYGPYGLDNTTYVGQQDGPGTTRPQYDGNVSVATTATKWNIVSTYDSTKVTPRTSTSGSVVTQTDKTPTVQHRVLYAAAGTYYAPISNSTVANCAVGANPCKITITTSSAHGMATGNSVTLSGMTPSSLNGSYPITKVGSSTTQYTITVTSRPSSITGNGTSFYSPVGCAANQAQQSSQGQISTLTSTTTTKTTTYTDTTIAPVTQTTHYKSTTPYTETLILWNGIQQSDKTVQGTTSNSSTTDSATTGSAPYPDGPRTNPSTVVGTPSTSSSSSSWASDGTAAVLSCVTTATAKASGATSAVTSDPAGTTTTTYSSPVATSPATTTTSGTPYTVTTDPVQTQVAVSGPTTVNTSTGGSTNSLADVAMYYYMTTLRSDDLGNCQGALKKSVCDASQPVVGFDEDTKKELHMSTYTLSLGNSGTMLYDPNYQSQTVGDYANVKNGSANWPVPSSDAGAVNIDDLWHAAVNGRGRYFSANDPNSLASSLAGTLSTITGVIGSASAAATSTLQPVKGDNGVFIAQFKSQDWTGDLKAYTTMDVNTGAVVTSKLDDKGNPVDLAIWSASALLTSDTVRTIYYFRPSGVSDSFTGSLQPLVYSTSAMTTDERAFFDNACSKAASLTQCTGNATNDAAVNSGANMVSFLRGQTLTQYRARKSVLGDIVNSSPVYVGKPSMNYTENNYTTFKTQQASRKATVYVGANDGMLHAFNAEMSKDGDGNAIATADSGKERWAYMPRLVMPYVYQLADTFYASKHQYFVDATPAVGDVYDATLGKWRTILVGGLNAGGKGYYALDITDPTAPIALWEFTDAQRLGYSFGNPIITKRKDGTWIVAFTSGYNNTDGGGHLFAVNALTGAKVLGSTSGTIDTGVGSAGSSSGLGKLNVWVDSDTENLAQRFYAGDLLGNIWRFDIDGNQEPKNAALAIAQLADSSDAPQPITTMPMLAQVDSDGVSVPVVYVGTGRYLGKSDVTSTGQQSIYAIKDSLSSTGIGKARASAAQLVKQKVSDTSPRVVGDASTPVNWSSSNGWYVDLVSAGERINVDMLLAFDVLTAAANKPAAVATDCTDAGKGTSLIYKLNIKNGMGTATEMSTMVAGLSAVQLQSGMGVVIVTKTDATTPATIGIDPSAQPGKQAHRTSWRELAD